MSPGFVRALAWRYIFGAGPSRRESLRRIRGGVLGIALSLVPLVLVYEMASGMIQGITQRFLETWSAHVQVQRYGDEDPASLEALARRLRDEGLAEAAVPELRGTGLVRAGEQARPVLIRGVPSDLLARDPAMARYLTLRSGTFTLEEARHVVLGEGLARSLGVGPGDTLRMVTYGGGPWTGLPRLSTFEVQGVVASGYQDLDKLWAFVALERAHGILGADNRNALINLKIADPYRLDNPLFPRSGPVQTAAGDFEGWEAYRSALGTVLDGDDGRDASRWDAFTWWESQRHQLEHFAGTRTLLLVIMVLIVVVASVNVSSTVILLVLEKQEDLAMLRSLGARRKDILVLFLLMGALTGALGAVLGLSAGALLSLVVNEIIHGLEWLLNGAGALVYHLGALVSDPGTPWQGLELLNPEFYLERIPVELHGPDLLLMGLLTLALSTLAALVPAYRAARLSPGEVMRKV